MNKNEMIDALRTELLRCADALDAAAKVLGSDKQIVTAATCRERAFNARITASMGKVEDKGQAGASGLETGQGVGVSAGEAGGHDPLAIAPFDPANMNGYNPLQSAYAAAASARRKAVELAFIAAGKK